MRVFIRGDDVERLMIAPLDVGDGLFIDRENAILSAGFDRHIRNGETVGHGKGMDARAGEFQRLVQRTIDADHTDQCQDDILTGDVLRLRAGQDDFDRIRHFEPCFAGRHGNAEVSRTDAGREAAQRAVGAGMRVRADGDHAGPYEAFFRKQCMLDTDTPLLEIIDNAIFMRKVTDDLRKSGRLDILCRLEMIRNENDLLLVEYRDTDAFEFRNGRRRGDIIRHDQVKAAIDQIPCFHRIDAGMLGQDLLCHCHTHTISSSAISHFCCNKKIFRLARDERFAVPLLFIFLQKYALCLITVRFRRGLLSSACDSRMSSMKCSCHFPPSNGSL